MTHCRHNTLGAAISFCLADVKSQKLETASLPDVMLLGQFPNPGASDFLASSIGLTLDNAGKFNLSSARQANLMISFQQIGRPGLSRLRIDPYDRFKSTADVAGQLGLKPEDLQEPRVMRAALLRGKIDCDRKWSLSATS